MRHTLYGENRSSSITRSLLQSPSSSLSSLLLEAQFWNLVATSVFFFPRNFFLVRQQIIRSYMHSKGSSTSYVIFFLHKYLLSLSVPCWEDRIFQPCQCQQPEAESPDWIGISQSALEKKARLLSNSEVMLNQQGTATVFKMWRDWN